MKGPSRRPTSLSFWVLLLIVGRQVVRSPMSQYSRRFGRDLRECIQKIRSLPWKNLLSTFPLFVWDSSQISQVFSNDIPNKDWERVIEMIEICRAFSVEWLVFSRFTFVFSAFWKTNHNRDMHGFLWFLSLQIFAQALRDEVRQEDRNSIYSVWLNDSCQCWLAISQLLTCESWVNNQSKFNIQSIINYYFLSFTFILDWFHKDLS